VIPLQRKKVGAESGWEVGHEGGLKKGGNRDTVLNGRGSHSGKRGKLKMESINGHHLLSGEGAQ